MLPGSCPPSLTRVLTHTTLPVPTPTLNHTLSPSPTLNRTLHYTPIPIPIPVPTPTPIRIRIPPPSHRRDVAKPRCSRCGSGLRCTCLKLHCGGMWISSLR